jgi:hypothetical protein
MIPRTWQPWIALAVLLALIYMALFGGVFR